MNTQATITLATSPSESLRALERAVAPRFNWRILIGGKTDQPRFVIEKRVRYDLLRGLPMYALYQIIGSFQITPSGETTLQYIVSGDGGPALFHASLLIGAALIITLALGSFVFSPLVAGNWLGILLLGVLLTSIIVYGVFAHRNYQGHLRELNGFMEEFAQQMGSPQT